MNINSLHMQLNMEGSRFMAYLACSVYTVEVGRALPYYYEIQLARMSHLVENLHLAYDLTYSFQR